MVVDFFYDVVCPYAYVASERLPELCRRAGATLRWRPVLLGGMLRAVGSPDQPAMAMSAPKARLNLLDAPRQAGLAGVEMSWHPRHPVRTVDAMRLLVACRDEDRPALSRRLYRAYWVDHLDVSDAGLLSALAEEFGVAPGFASDEAVKAGLRANTDEALALGAFGVPTIRVGDRFWWGADRLPMVAEALGMPREEAPPAETGGTITFFHDVSSPFSYLASTQVEAVADRSGARVEWVPILLGGLFRSIGTPDVPLLAMAAARQKYVTTDLGDFARWWGVPFRFPSAFPFRSVTPQRVLVQEPRAARALYDGGWVHDRDLSDADVLRGLLDDAGFDGAALLDGAARPDVKAALIANTERAAQAGACGVPTFEVGGHLFWGQDRLFMVEQVLRGWVPPEARGG